MLRVLFLGFSVTEQALGYTREVRRLDRDLHVRTRAIGAGVMWNLPYLSGLVPFADFDLCVVEAATCLRYAEHDPAEYRNDLTEIARDCLSAGCRPVFLNLFRRGIDHAQDRLRAAIRGFCGEFGIPCLDLVDELAAFERQGSLADYLRDGVHSTPAGANFYAARIVPFLYESAGYPVERARGLLRRAVTRRIFTIPELDPVLPVTYFSRGGFDFRTLEIAEGDQVDLALPAGWRFRGLLFLRGPRVGLLQIESPPAPAVRMQAFDTMSFYRRFNGWRLPKPAGSRCSIRQLPGIPEIELRKGDRDLGPRLGEIAGILADSDPVSGDGP